jgi:hypothetical protein
MGWDKATGGAYSEEAQANEKHFAPAAGHCHRRALEVTVCHLGNRVEQVRIRVVPDRNDDHHAAGPAPGA